MVAAHLEKIHDRQKYTCLFTLSLRKTIFVIIFAYTVVPLTLYKVKQRKRQYNCLDAVGFNPMHLGWSVKEPIAQVPKMRFNREKHDAETIDQTYGTYFIKFCKISRQWWTIKPRVPSW